MWAGVNAHVVTLGTQIGVGYAAFAAGASPPANLYKNALC